MSALRSLNRENSKSDASLQVRIALDLAFQRLQDFFGTAGASGLRGRGSTDSAKESFERRGAQLLLLVDGDGLQRAHQSLEFRQSITAGHNCEVLTATRARNFPCERLPLNGAGQMMLVSAFQRIAQLGSMHGEKEDTRVLHRPN